jgi:DNA modification methylase
MIDLRLGDCLDVLPTLADASIDAVICDPPYPCIKREYGTWTEAEWWALIVEGVIPHVRRVLKPTGSAVFILQPNSRKVGSMRGWLWKFMGWACDEWNLVQDAWWWNTSTMPVGGANVAGLLRPSLKACVWLGDPNCYREQDSVLLSESAANIRHRTKEDFDEEACPSRVRSATEGPRDNYRRMRTVCVQRGGTTPFNVLPFGSDGRWSGGTHGHGASTPLKLADWWVRYISAPSGTVLDPFMGSGTVGLAALKRGRSFVGIERVPAYHAIAVRRLTAARDSAPLFAGTT